MILVINLNASVDKRYKMKDLIKVEVMRAAEVDNTPGGKGIALESLDVFKMVSDQSLPTQQYKVKTIEAELVTGSVGQPVEMQKKASVVFENDVVKTMPVNWADEWYAPINNTPIRQPVSLHAVCIFIACKAVIIQIRKHFCSALYSPNAKTVISSDNIVLDMTETSVFPARLMPRMLIPNLLRTSSSPTLFPIHSFGTCTSNMACCSSISM